MVCESPALQAAPRGWLSRRRRRAVVGQDVVSAASGQAGHCAAPSATKEGFDPRARPGKGSSARSAAMSVVLTPDAEPPAPGKSGWCGSRGAGADADDAEDTGRGGPAVRAALRRDRRRPGSHSRRGEGALSAGAQRGPKDGLSTACLLPTQRRFAASLLRSFIALRRSIQGRES